MTTKTRRPGGYIPLKSLAAKRPKLLAAVPPLEERHCACGCGRMFRVMPNSDQKFASKGCSGMSVTWGALSNVRIPKVGEVPQ